MFFSFLSPSLFLMVFFASHCIGVFLRKWYLKMKRGKSTGLKAKNTSLKRLYPEKVTGRKRPCVRSMRSVGFLSPPLLSMAKMFSDNGCLSF